MGISAVLPYLSGTAPSTPPPPPPTTPPPTPPATPPATPPTTPPATPPSTPPATPPSTPVLISATVTYAADIASETRHPFTNTHLASTLQHFNTTISPSAKMILKDRGRRHPVRIPPRTRRANAVHHSRACLCHPSMQAICTGCACAAVHHQAVRKSSVANTPWLALTLSVCGTQLWGPAPLPGRSSNAASRCGTKEMRCRWMDRVVHLFGC